VKATLLALGVLTLIVTSRAEPEPSPSLSDEDITRTFQRIARGEQIERDTLLRALVCDQTTLRARAAHLLGESGDLSVVPALITALSDDSSHVGANYRDPAMCTTRWWANESLKRLTKQDFGFRWDASIAEREIAINKWRVWASSTK
jgi:HEAT repeat protein